MQNNSINTNNSLLILSNGKLISKIHPECEIDTKVALDENESVNVIQLF